jgi:RNA polymerase primary sigma factor
VRGLKIAQDRLTQRTENTARYFTEVEHTPLLTADEEYKIGVRAQNGDEAAIQQLISANLRFVVSVAKQYSSQAVQLDELICQGNIGLCEAARLFDPSRGFKFISYAVWHIRKEIIYYLNTYYRSIRIPQNIILDTTKVKKINELILQEKGRYGTAEEIHEEFIKFGKNVTVDYISKLTHADSNRVSLESNDPDVVISPIDWLSGSIDTTDLVDASDLTRTVNIALSKLTTIQRDIVTRKLGIGYDHPEALSTIAASHDRTPEWARQMYIKALKIMKVRLASVNLTQDRIINNEI